MIKTVKADRTKLVLSTRDASSRGIVGITALQPAEADDPEIKWSADNDCVLLTAIPAGNTPDASDFDEAEPDDTVCTGRGEVLAVEAQEPGTVKLTGVTTDGSNKKLMVTVTVRGEVTRLRFTPAAASKGVNDVTETAERDKYTGNMKKNSSMTLKPIFDINRISGTRTEKEIKKIYTAYQKVTDLTVSYRSSNTAVATVDSKGKIMVNKNAAEGQTATILAASADGRCKAQITITVVK
ncbi:MAG: hypothetical protein IKO80_06690, partial [Lachnospiraceae bacterium]|nr:hypothetical protein [Lachnospiraceae bacterium]